MFVRQLDDMRKTNLVNIKFFIFIVFASAVLTGCVNTEGTLKIKGRVLDECTKTGIPRKNIIVQGLVHINNKLVPIEVGQFSTDSSGCFIYSLSKIKDVHDYNFCLVGDSDYLFTTKTMTLFDLERNEEYLLFSLSKLADLTIRLNRKSNTHVKDTLCLSWESNKVYFWFLYPYNINNYGRTNFFGPTSGTGLIWIGGSVNSTINTKVFAGKKTELSWELYRNGKRMKFTDTITCKRDFANIVYFTY